MFQSLACEGLTDKNVSIEGNSVTLDLHTSAFMNIYRVLLLLGERMFVRILEIEASKIKNQNMYPYDWINQNPEL